MVDKDTLADYRRGVDTGVMKSATPNVVRHLLDHIAALQAVVDRLPVTADGVPVVPGMEVWQAAYDEEQEDGSIYHSKACECWAGPIHAFMVHCGRGEKSHAGPIDVRQYYSTEAAAAAAQGDKT